MKGWINSSKEPEAMLRGCCGGFGAGAGASAILASPGCGGCPGRGALCRGVLLGWERWLALALRPRAALVLVWASLSRRRSPFWGEKGFFPGTAARGRVLPSGVGDRDVCGRTVAFLGAKVALGEFFVWAGGMMSLGTWSALFRAECSQNRRSQTPNQFWLSPRATSSDVIDQDEGC